MQHTRLNGHHILVSPDAQQEENSMRNSQSRAATPNTRFTHGVPCQTLVERDSACRQTALNTAATDKHPSVTIRTFQGKKSALIIKGGQVIIP
jgi:hypothetical protein